MIYDGDIIRPPSEANSIIIQVTVGCSHNRCTFCGAYKDKKFRLRSDQEILANIKFAAQSGTRQRRVFLADGDTLILSQKRLLHIFSMLREYLPHVKKVGMYANAKAIRSKSINDLLELRSIGLNRIYMGLESGDNATLDNVAKGETDQSMIAAATLVRKADIFLSATVILGLGGLERSIVHARETGRVLSLMQPRQIAVLCLMPISGTPLGKQVAAGDFVLPDSEHMLLELRELIGNITCQRVLFMSNHASNYLPLSGVLARDRKEMTERINMALDAKYPLMPEYFRTL